MRVITFSRYFPAKHPRKGQPTNFVEKMVLALMKDSKFNTSTQEFFWLNAVKGLHDPFTDFEPKYHTIRAGNNWNAGDWFSPRVWLDKPYKSKQAAFWEPIQIKKVWTFKLKVRCKGVIDAYINGKVCAGDIGVTLAKNDGLSFDDFRHWFDVHPKKLKNGNIIFKGQIICWSANINYE